MNKQQLQTARLQLWSQNGHARLTLDDVRAWLETISFCPVAPLALPGNPSVPTLLEATQGRPFVQATLEERASLQPILARMVQTKAAVPLLMISPASEQPDFIANLEALPLLYAMRGDREWKAAPAATGQRRVSQLALHCWQELDRNGAQTLAELQRSLGGEVTQPAVMRGLCELWGHLRVYPQLAVDDAGENVSPKWELLARTHPKQISIGAGMSQQAALSGVLSLYLAAVIAASDEEIVAFLSPLASQSKTREMVHGLTATRQLGRVPYEGGMLLHLKDGLSEELLVDLSVPEPQEEEGSFAERPARGPIKKWEPRSRPVRTGDRPYVPRERTEERPPRDFGSSDRRSTGPNTGWKRPEKFAAGASSAGRFEKKPFRSAAPAGPAGEYKRRPEHDAGERPAFRPAARPASRPGRDFRSDKPQKPWQPPAAEPRSGEGSSEGYKPRAATGPKFREGGFQQAKPRFSKPGFSKPGFSKSASSKFRPARPAGEGRAQGDAPRGPRRETTERPATSGKPAFRPAGRPAFRQDAGSGQNRPFKKDFGSKPVRKNFAAAGEQGGERKFVKRDDAQGSGSDRPRRTAPGASKFGASRQSGSKGSWQAKPRQDWKNPRPAEEPRIDRPRESKPRDGRPREGKSKEDRPNEGRPRASRPANRDAGSFGAGKPAAGKFGRDKGGSGARSGKARPAKHAARKAAAGRPAAQGPPRKEPFWAKPMNPKRKKKHD